MDCNFMWRYRFYLVKFDFFIKFSIFELIRLQFTYKLEAKILLRLFPFLVLLILANYIN